jgi:hypothetical protein
MGNNNLFRPQPYPVHIINVYKSSIANLKIKKYIFNRVWLDLINKMYRVKINVKNNLRIRLKTK